jgi:hypothetical protein
MRRSPLQWEPLHDARNTGALRLRAWHIPYNCDNEFSAEPAEFRMRRHSSQ